MRIAVVFRSPPPQSDRDGAARLKRLAVAFADRGHDVTVYCVGWWGEDTRRIHLDGVTYEAVVHDRPALFYTRLTGLLARHRPDVVLVSPDPPGTVVSARIGALTARAPLVCDWYGDEPGAADSGWAGTAARLPARVVTPSELQRTQVRERGASGERTVVVPNGIDFSLVESTAPGERCEVVYARDLDEAANLESLLLALAELRGQDGWTATVVGDGPEREAYETQARDLAIGDRVEFVGDLDREDRIAVYRGAHTFVQTSRREAFADELLWALAAGCVGVVEYQEGSSAHELVERRERGIRVTDMESLDDAIADAWTFEHRDLDTDFREFDRDAVVEDYLELFRECGAE
ncbi:glycosyltransferase family 4 protein [Natronomonas amylolytica]|uniref:glycosyltransferase family 4 protein n=1 Tax=Natronomonas amylolytica TaxID=3108498 RepID=UPI003009CF50